MEIDQNETDLITRARQGDVNALSEIFAMHRERLRRMIQTRMDIRLQSRIDASDVIQEAYLEASTRIEDYFRNPTMPLFLWLRFLVGERLITLHRHHLATKMRNAGLEVSLYREGLPEASSAALAAQLVGQLTSPSQAAMRAEKILRLQEAINTIDPADREVLALRHFEQLSRSETAQVLRISEAAAGKRYFRALKRLRDLLRKMPGGLEELGQ